MAASADDTATPVAAASAAAVKDTDSTSHPLVVGKTKRTLSLARQVDKAGGIAAWNDRTAATAKAWRDLENSVNATTIDEALAEISKCKTRLDAYKYFRVLHNRNIDLYYALIISDPAKFMPIAYTPTVGEACQKFGRFPHFARGCYVCVEHRGKFREVLTDYAKAHLDPSPLVPGQYLCDCIVFSDGGRILGLGDLGAWGMGIPIGKLDLYTVCGGVNPRRTVPIIIDAGNLGTAGNTAALTIREHANYTGLKQDRVRVKNSEGNLVNKMYYGDGNVIEEFMTAAQEVFGKTVLLQFEDFNSNDAFPLLARTRTRFLTYNDDIQGTAAVTVAGILGALKVKYPKETDLLGKIKNERILFFGSGSANLGAAMLLTDSGVLSKSNVFMTGSRGLLWKNKDGTAGVFRNDKQKFYAVSPEPTFPHTKLIDLVTHIKPTILVGAAGRAPNSFTPEVIKTLTQVNAPGRPVVFALSNPTSQAECTSETAYEHSDGTAIYGSGSQMNMVTKNGVTRQPGMVNNVYVFPAMSFAAIHCHAKEIPDRLFLVAAEAVANSLDDQDLKMERVIPSRSRIRECCHHVATEVILACQKLGLAQRHVGDDRDAVFASVGKAMWSPTL